MNINELLLNIPTKLSSMVEVIYLASKKDNKFYKVFYTGSKIKTEEPSKYKAFTKELSKIDANLASEIGRNESIKKVYGNKLIASFKIEGFIMVFIIPLDGIVNTVPSTTIEDCIDLDEETDEKDILIIADDSELVTNFFSKIFSEEYNVLQAKNGEEAKNLILANKDRHIKGVFIDLNMHVMSGYELLDYLQDEGLLDTIHVSVISGEDSEDGIRRVTDYKVVDMLQKPFTRQAAESIVYKTVNYEKEAK